MELKTKLAALGLTVGLVGGGAAGVILSSAEVSGASSAVAVQDNGSQSTTTTPSGGQGGGEQGQHPGRQQFLADTLAPLVKDGTLTQEQADKVIAALEQAAPKGGEGRGHNRGPELQAAATALGMDPADLRTALRDGKTLAQVAQARGVDPKVVIAAMVAEAHTRLDQAVANGRITQEQADKKLADVTTRITDVVNNGFKAGMRGPGHDGAAPGAGAGSSDSGGG